MEVYSLKELPVRPHSLLTLCTYKTPKSQLPLIACDQTCELKIMHLRT
jgi:hypothetical protein